MKNVYAWNTNGKLIGGGSGTKENTYSFVSGDGSANFVIPALGQMESESYEGFGFGSTWKNYDGWSLPMLKVFLTKGEVSQNGVTAADGLAAFNNANSLIVFVPDPETGGMYMTVFSAQIAGSFGPDGVFNPNNLGYDLEGVYVRGNNNGFLHSGRLGPHQELPRAQGGALLPQRRHGVRRGYVSPPPVTETGTKQSTAARSAGGFFMSKRRNERETAAKRAAAYADSIF